MSLATLLQRRPARAVARPMRRVALGSALAALAATALTACGNQYDAYCHTVRAKQTSLSKVLDADGKAALLEALPAFEQLKKQAPSDVQPQWQILVTALTGLQQALREAHVDPATYDRATTTISQQEKDRIDAAAAQLGTQRVAAALQAVAQETRDVCHTPLTLG